MSPWDPAVEEPLAPAPWGWGGGEGGCVNAAKIRVLLAIEGVLPLCLWARGTVLITSVGKGRNKGSFAKITQTWRRHGGCTSLKLLSLLLSGSGSGR